MPKLSGRRELARLDPFTFRVLPGAAYGVDDVIVGTTGAFAVVWAEGGPASRFRMWRAHRRDLRRARRAANTVKWRLWNAGIHTRIEAVLCLGGDTVFAPRTVRGVRVVPVAQLVADITARERQLLPHQASRGAGLLAAGAGL